MYLSPQIFLTVGITAISVYLLHKYSCLLDFAPWIFFIAMGLFLTRQWMQIRNSRVLFEVLKKGLLLLQPFFKKKAYILFDNLYESDAECIDAYCIFQYMQEHHIPAYYVLWKKNPLYEKLRKEGKLRHVIVVRKSVNNSYNFEFFRKIWWKLLETKVILTSFGALNNEITKFLYENEFITYHHIQHGVVLLKTSVLASPCLDYHRYNRCLVSNEREADILCQFGWKRENLPMIGLPRWDLQKRVPHTQKTIFAMFTWRRSFCRGKKHMFPGTLEQTKYNQNIKSFLTDERLQSLLKQYNVKLQMAFHHALLNQTGGRYQFSCDNVEILPASNISQYIGRSDLLITDYSSVFFDFAFLNIPVIFYRPDFDDETLCERDHEDMKNARSKDDLLYNICYDKDKAIQCVEKYIKNGFILEDENKRKNDSLFSTKENITAKFVNYLEKL